jgi:deoxyribodipyrimidine photolyase-related protein
MKTTVWILGDQLSPHVSAFDGLEPSDCTVLMIESLSRARWMPYHKQKLVLVWAAMRHFAEELHNLGYSVDYHTAQQDLMSPLAAHIQRHRPARIRLMETAEVGRSARLAWLVQSLDVEVEPTPNSMFLSDRAEFGRQAGKKKTLLMETFYRGMRRRTGLLMDGEEPIGGQWNFDRLNRERPPSGHSFPPIPHYEPDKITREVMNFVAQEFAGNFGELADFGMPVTRKDASAFFEDFLDRRLDLFGPYEDAIVVGQRALYHSLVSPLLNIGLLEPLDICRRAEARYQEGSARLNSVEGFVRQIIGWREFIYQVYHLRMPDYVATNFFEADLALPEFYWTGDTDMVCIADAVNSLQRWGINHHIQRLMITGNFALIAGIDPQAVNQWYWLAYADAYEWVVTPNVLGLSLYADGGLIATKPYAASANYINKMSDCCKDCAYDRSTSLGEKACPFNALYWDFLARNREKLQGNPRMNLMLAMLDKRNPRELTAVRRRALQIREKLRNSERL